jgi:hypothetical protein
MRLTVLAFATNCSDAKKNRFGHFIKRNFYMRDQTYIKSPGAFGSNRIFPSSPPVLHIVEKVRPNQILYGLQEVSNRISIKIYFIF